MALVTKYHFFTPTHSDPVYRSLWGQVIGTYTTGPLTYRYEQYAGNTNGAVIGKLTAGGTRLGPPDGGLDYTLTPPRDGLSWAPLPAPPEPIDTKVDTATLPLYDMKSKPVPGTTAPPIGTTPPPIGTTPPPNADCAWTPQKEQDFRAWADQVATELAEHDERLKALEEAVTEPPPVVPPTPTPVVGCSPVTFAVSVAVPPNGGSVLLSSGSWYSPGQTNRFGDAVPAGYKFAITDIVYSNKDRDPGGSSGVSLNGIYTLRNHNPTAHFKTPLVMPEGTVIDGAVQNDSESGPTLTIVRVHGWFFMPGHEPICLQ